MFSSIVQNDVFTDNFVHNGFLVLQIMLLSNTAVSISALFPVVPKMNLMSSCRKYM